MLTIVLGVLALLVALTAVPLVVRFRLDFDGALRRDLRLEWAFGLVRLRMTGESPSSTREEPSPPAADPSVRDSTDERVAADSSTPVGEEAPSDGAGRYLAPLRVRAFRQRVLRYLADCPR